MAQDAMAFLARNRKQLGEEGFAVFFFLASRLDFQNFILVNQAEVGRELGMHRSNVNKAIQKLKGMGVLTEGPKSGVSPTFRLNPVVGWKGKAKEHFGALREAQKRGWTLIDNDQLPCPSNRPVARLGVSYASQTAQQGQGQGAACLPSRSLYNRRSPRHRLLLNSHRSLTLRQ